MSLLRRGGVLYVEYLWSLLKRVAYTNDGQLYFWKEDADIGFDTSRHLSNWVVEDVDGGDEGGRRASRLSRTVRLSLRDSGVDHSTTSPSVPDELDHEPIWRMSGRLGARVSNGGAALSKAFSRMSRSLRRGAKSYEPMFGGYAGVSPSVMAEERSGRLAALGASADRGAVALRGGIARANVSMSRLPMSSPPPVAPSRKGLLTQTTLGLGGPAVGNSLRSNPPSPTTKLALQGGGASPVATSRKGSVYPLSLSPSPSLASPSASPTKWKSASPQRRW